VFIFGAAYGYLNAGSALDCFRPGSIIIITFSPHKQVQIQFQETKSIAMLAHTAITILAGFVSLAAAVPVADGAVPYCIPLPGQSAPSTDAAQVQFPQGQ